MPFGHVEGAPQLTERIGGPCYNKEDGSKCTLSSMRNLLFEKQNCTIHQDTQNNLVLTFLDFQDPGLEKDLKEMYAKLSASGKNKVLWWGNRSLVLEFKK